MRKRMFLPFGFIFVALMQTLLVAGVSARSTAQAQWTFMIYVCGDNDLEKYWPDKNLPALESVGSTDYVHFVALVDLKTRMEGCQLQHIMKGYTEVVESYPELNLGDPQVCISFVNKVKQLYPAAKYLLDFWNHGNGWDYFCYDESANDWLILPELRQIMEAVGYIDIVAFDACDMGQIDVYYETLGHVGYLVGSEESVPGDGFPYDTNAQDLVNNPFQDARTYAIEMVINYGQYYTGQGGLQYATLSALDANQLLTLKTAFTTWTSEMHANLATYKRKYSSALLSAKKMWATSYYVDMGDYMDQLLKQDIPQSLVTATQNVKSALSNAVIAYWNGNKMEVCQGLTFYWAKSNYWKDPWRTRYITEVSWGQVTGWAAFLDAYYG
jgi:hypothetical protein